MDADGSNPRAVTPEGVEALAPAVMPDGRVAYQKRTGYARWSIESVAADGSGARAESDGATDYWLPDFTPRAARWSFTASGPPSARRKPSRRFSVPARCSRPTIPADVAIADRTVTLYPMRHTTGLAPHPDRNETAVTIENEAGTRLVLADFDGANQRELFAVPNVGIVSGTPNRCVRHQVVRRRRMDHVHARVLLRPGHGRGRHLGHARGRLRAAQLERGHDRQRRRRSVLAGRRAARVSQRAQRPIRSVLGQARRHGGARIDERRSARELPRVLAGRRVRSRSRRIATARATVAAT